MAPVKVITVNRRAYHDYHILERFEAGLVLTGTEIKSIRAGRVDIREAYAKPQDGELWLFNAHIAQYKAGGVYNHEPTRPRKLLLHREQIAELTGKLTQKGLTLIPLQLYIKDHLAKVELGLAKGKKLYDKRRAIIEREKDREAQEAVRRSLKGMK
jgi:SsrA-binding protein